MKSNVDTSIYPIRSSVDSGIYGFLDYVSPSSKIDGWVTDRNRPERELSLMVYLNNVRVGIATHGLDRPDVTNKLETAIRPGFSFDWSDRDPNSVALISNEIETKLALRMIDTEEFVLNITIDKPDFLFWEHARRNAVAQENTAKDPVRLIAFYLPQYHPIPENNTWWGEGFTEWHNVARGKAAFPGHYQPHIPSDLGFYDLRVPETRKKQADLAKRFGIDGFCYYYYWFAGKKLLDLPISEVLKTGEPDFPFCICWANETWSRRWDGSESDILIAQEHDAENDERFIAEIIPILTDPRYIRVNDAPILLVYRLSLFPNAAETADTWRRICREQGFELHLCAVESFDVGDPARYGFDSSVEFPPHKNVSHGVNDTIKDLDPAFKGGIFDYLDFIGRDLRKAPPPYPRFKGLMLGWDNTARRNLNANMFINSSPAAYESWLNNAINYTKDNLPANQQLIFINAWNEWAEGTHLEPDLKYGTQFLEATYRAVHGTSNWFGRVPPLLNSQEEDTEIERLVRLANTEISSRDRVIAHLTKLLPANGEIRTVAQFSKTSEDAFKSVRQQFSGFYGNIDRFGIRGFDGRAVVAKNSGLHFLSGWFVMPDIQVSEHSPFWLLIISTSNNKERYSALVTRRCKRLDVSQIPNFQILGSEVTDWSGFITYLNFADVPAGTYTLCALSHGEGTTIRVDFQGSFEVF